MLKKGSRGWSWLFQSAPQALYDRQILWLSFGLMLVGLIMVSSASIPVSLRLFDDPFHFAIRQGIYIVLALIAGAMTVSVPLSRWQHGSIYLLMIAIFLLFVVLIAGNSVNGAVRWLPLGPINLQPAEVMKLVMMLFLAGYLVRWHESLRESFITFLKPIGLLGFIAGLLLLQPDLGSAVVLGVITLGMLFIAGAKLWQFGVLLLIGILVVGGLIASAPYRIRRVTSFLDPWEDPFGAGYQLTQSLMAFGRGDWWGQGLGNSIQKLEYLPEAHTDFVVAVLAEEVGLIGVILVLLMVFALVYRAFFIGKRCVESNQFYGGYLAFGIGFWFAFQALVNVGAAAGMVPTKGLTLPLVSYGGSSLIMMTMGAAFLLRIDYEYRLASVQAHQRVSGK